MEERSAIETVSLLLTFKHSLTLLWKSETQVIVIINYSSNNISPRLYAQGPAASLVMINFSEEVSTPV